jgi:putative transposase
MSARCSGRIASRSAGPAASWASVARRSGARRPSPTMSPGSWPGWWRWPRNTAGMATAGSRRCCGPRGSPSTTNASSGFGRREGLKVPARQPKRGRLWLNDGSCIRLRPERKDHVWSYDFVRARTRDGRAFRMLNIIDEHTRECLAIDVARRLTSDDVLERLSDLFVRRGLPDHIRSDNGPEFTTKAVRGWLVGVGVKTLFIEPGSPWENGSIESFNGKQSDELLDGEVFDTLREAKVLIERWRVRYNTVRPHSSLGYRPPAPEAIMPWTSALGASLLGPAPMAGAIGALT